MNRGGVPKIGMAGGLRLCLLLFRVCFIVVLHSHWSRGAGERELTSLSIVTLAHGVPSATPLSALLLTCLKSSNNNNRLKMLPRNNGAHRVPYRGAHFPRWWLAQIVCLISCFQVAFMWLALGRNLQINAVFSLILQSEKSMGRIMPSLVQHTILVYFYPERHSKKF